MKSIRVLLGTVATLSAAQLYAGEAVFYVTEDGAPISDLAVSVDGKKKLVGKNGFVIFDVKDGEHSVELSQFGEWAGEFDFTTTNDQNAEIQVEMIGGEAIPEVQLYSEDEATAALGQISGYLTSEETGGGVEGARISVSDTLSVVTDQDGFFQLEAPRGEYDLTIAHPSYGNRDVKNIRVLSNVATNVNMDMSLSGDGVIEEVVAVGSYIPSTATAQERDSSAVLDSIGSEQFSRFGDSNAASALKRVVGVSVSGGKYIVSRGLNERHTAIMLNGASLPSPDPSRRVVPLDIFPSTILDGIDVQKSFTPDVYADSTGAAVRLNTKKFPEEFEGKISGSLGYVSGLTFTNREVQQSEGLDIFGIGAHGDRAIQESFEGMNDNDPRSSSIAGDFADNLKTEEQMILPDVSLELSAGNTFYDDGDIQVGYTGSVKYSNKWSKQDRIQRSYDVNDGGLTLDDNYEQERTSNDINLGAGLSLGLVSGDNEYTSNTMVLRQTHTENVVETGVGGDQDRESIGYYLGWYERQFLFQQFSGEHFFAGDFETDLNWQVSVSQAKLDAPDERYYSFERDPDDGEEFVLYWSSLDRIYNELTDDNIDTSIDLSTLVFANDSFQTTLKYGASMFQRSRSADGSTVNYKGNGQTANGFEGNTDISDVVNSNIASAVAGVVVGSRPSDDYEADWDLTAYYLMADFEMFDQFKLLLGGRAEKSEMNLETFTIGSTAQSPVADNANIEDDEMFKSISLLYHVSEDLQLRATNYDTINRPDFREISNSFYIDPESGDTYVGNPRLDSSKVENTDVRAEYYFSDSENVSLAYFTKDFEQPIERTLKTGGDVRSFTNADSGKLSGFELDFKKEFDFDNYSTFVSGNYAIIDSEVELEVGSQVQKQNMQGQPEDLANLQVGFDDLEAGTQYTLLVNYQGRSLEALSLGEEPNVFKQGRTQIDFNFSMDMTERFTLKAKVKNMMDSKYEYLQGGELYREYKKGMEASIGGSLSF